MKQFVYFVLGVSTTINIVMAIDYYKKSKKCKILMKKMEKKNE